VAGKVNWEKKYTGVGNVFPLSDLTRIIHELSGLTMIFRAQVTLTVSGGRDR